MADTAMTTTTGSALDVWSAEEQRIIKEQIAGGMKPAITDAELRYFARFCQARGLSPIAGQVVPVRRGGRMVIQVTIHGFRSLADDTGDYAPGPAPTYEFDDSGRLYAATAYVKKWAHGEWHLISDTAFWDEYGEGAEGPLWRTKPRIMLAKCAEALALRRAFPAKLSGLYTDDELDRDDTRQQTRQSESRPAAALPPPANEPMDYRAAQQAAATLVEARATAKPQPTRITPAPGSHGERVSNEAFSRFWSTVLSSGWKRPDVIKAAGDLTGTPVGRMNPAQLDGFQEALLSGRLALDGNGTWVLTPMPMPTMEPLASLDLDGVAWDETNLVAETAAAK